MLDDLLLRMRSLFRRKTTERELGDELRFHFDQLVERQVRAGLPVDEARRRAQLEFGGFGQVQEECRDARGTQFLDGLMQDLRFSFRMLRKVPGFTAVAVLTLALGIGANTAIFSVLDSLLLRALPVANPGQLVMLTDPDSHGGYFGSQTGDRSLLAYSEFQYLQAQNQVFSSMFAADSSLETREVRLGESNRGGEKQQARVLLVSGDYFSTLGVNPAAGTFFMAQVDRARGGAAVAVVSYAFWNQRFGLNPAMLGKTVEIHDTAFEIIGVTPPGFFGETVGQSPDIWVPMMMQDAVYPGQDYLNPSPDGILNQHMWIQVMGRLKPTVTLSQASAEINVQFKRYLELAAGSKPATIDGQRRYEQRLDVQPGARGSSTLRSSFAKPFEILMFLVGLVLLIACANVANLLLARGAARQKEFAMRLAIGAGRSRLIRQLLTESLLLALLGAIAGIFLSYWADTLLLRMVSGRAAPGSVQLQLHPDARVLGFTLAVTVLTAILFGLLPSLQLTRLDLSPALKASVLSTASVSLPVRLPVGKILVVAQVAVSLILLVAAGLFVRSLARLGDVNLGYSREHLLLFRVDATGAGYKGPAATRLYQDVLQTISAVPGLGGATVSHNGLFFDSESGDPISVEGYAPKPDETLNSNIDHIGPRYFSTLGIPILMGREIEPQDSGSGLRAAVINETFAKRFFPNANPIGKHVRDTYPANPSDVEIVGVVSDIKVNSLREKARPRIYAPLFNPMWEETTAVFEVRTFADPASVSDLLRQAVQTTSAAIPPIEIKTMAGLVDQSLQTDRFIERLSEALGLLAMLLASVGLYGIMAYTVARRSREIGIRMALGAEPGDIGWQVLAETLMLVCIGIGVGLPLALLGSYLVRSMVFGLGFVDPVALLVAAMALVMIAALAAVLPAHRASRLDPIIALRYE
jgi:predicted permease